MKNCESESINCPISAFPIDEISWHSAVDGIENRYNPKKLKDSRLTRLDYKYAIKLVKLKTYNYNRNESF